MQSPLSRRDVFRSFVQSAAIAALPVELIRPGSEALSIGRIISATYVPSDPRLWIIAEVEKPERRAPLYVDDIVLLMRAVAMLMAHEPPTGPGRVPTFGFSLERFGSRMIPLFFPAFLDPLLAGSTVARTTLEFDLYLKRSGLGLDDPTARAVASEIDVLAAFVSRRLANGETVEMMSRSVHRFFFDLSCITDPSDDLRHVRYPDPKVRVVMPQESSARATFEPEMQFAALVEASFGRVLVRDDALGSDARRLRNLFILSKIAYWILQDVLATVDIAHLSRLPTAFFRVPNVPIRMATRIVRDQSTGRQITIQIAGGVRFRLSDDRKTSSVNRTQTQCEIDHIHPVTEVPPRLLVVSTMADNVPCVAIDISSVLGLRKERTS